MIQNSLHQQKLAANPYSSAWVSASAGTGKTKVLIDRLLALLLSGVEPARILCLTFTKAAAAEMQQRLLGNLEKWILEEDETLYQIVFSLLGETPTPEQLKRARELYTLVLETPHGMNISTIHGFCQSLLNRFPLEAGITPHFSVMDENEATLLLEEAKRHTLTDLLQQEKESLTKLLVTHFKDDSFQSVLEEILSNRRHFQPLMTLYRDEQAYADTLCSKLELPLGIDLLNPSLLNDYIGRHYDLSEESRRALLKIATDEENLILLKWLHASAEERADLFADYASLYLTKTGTIRKKCIFEPEAETVYRLQRTLNTIKIAQKSFCAFHIGHAIFQTYQALKNQRNNLDYEDLIEKTISLLTQKDIAPWILYKLDGGIEHLLVDEAQDTNPDQWRVILALTEDFFITATRQRTLFVVGDVKQSIYSFQGASPLDFLKLKEFFKTKSQQHRQPWYDLELDVSFRSTPEILSLVDKVINMPEHQKDIQFHQALITHLPWRQKDQGAVKLLPAIIKKPMTEEVEPWTIPDRYRLPETALEEVCRQVGLKIQELLRANIVLPSTGKPVEPKDILILVKQRGDIAPQLIRHLKKQGIPVSGMDRFVLTDHLAVQDLLALTEFLLLPQDDLSLASVLKSPLLGMSEEDLLALAATRKASLWQELSFREDEKPIYNECYNYLKELLETVDYLTPFELYHLILFKKEGLVKLRQRFSFEADEAIFELLAHAFDQSQHQSLTLQQYLGKLKGEKQQVKRDSSDTSQNQARLMTVHGSKGLQAPIVFVIEKFETRDKTERLLWDMDSAGRCQFMMVRPSNDSDTIYTSQLKDLATTTRDQEDKRLLYVALTRAQDHLYATGYGDSSLPDDSWYQLLSPFVSVEETHKAATPYYQKRERQSNFVNWLKNPVVHRPKLREEKVVTDEPINAKATRGIHIHKLFEILLDLDLMHHKKAIEVYMRSHALTNDQIDPIKILELVQGDLLRPFTKGMAELEIAKADGTLLRLDRVAIEESVIKILDYKTSENYPSSQEKTPKEILQQLGQYVTALAEVYPNHQIECYLLWTSAPVLHYVPNELLIK